MQIVTNVKKATSHLTVIKKIIKTSDEIVLCSGWMKFCGLREILPVIDAAIDRGASITLYTNAEHATKDSVAALSARPALRHINLRKPYLHTKLYYGARSDGFIVMSGSANITSGGLWKSEELSSLVSGKLGDDYHRQIAGYLDRLAGLA